MNYDSNIYAELVSDGIGEVLGGEEA